MKSFANLLTELRDYLTEAPAGIVFTFGRFNPISAGHEKLVKKVQDTAKKNNMQPVIYASQTNDKKKNPLQWKDKVKFMKKLFKGANISNDKSANTPFKVLEILNEKKIENVIMVVGSDRVDAFQTQMSKFIDKDLPNIKKFAVVSAGDRDPDSDGVTGISGSKMREFAKDDDFKKFLGGLPKGANLKIGQQIFDAVKKGLGIK